MAAWGRKYGARIAPALGFTHAPPCAATLPTIFRHVNRDEFAGRLGAWADSGVGSLPAAPEPPGIAVALDADNATRFQERSAGDVSDCVKM